MQRCIPEHGHGGLACAHHEENRAMTLVTLQRQAPVAPNTSSCRLCDAGIAGTFQDHLLVGQPGTSQLVAVVCERCGQALTRLLELCGPDLRVLVQDAHPSVESLAGLPRTAPRAPSEQPAEPPTLERTRQRLHEQAESLGRSERALRAEADKLGRE
jgi:hypothetical protein